MAGARSSPLTGLLRSRWLRWSAGAAAGPLLGLGCAATPTAQIAAPAVVVAQSPFSQSSLFAQAKFGQASASGIELVAYRPGTASELLPPVGPTLPPGHGIPAGQEAHTAVAVPAARVEAINPVPLDLKSVLRLAEEQNAQIALYRAKVHEAELDQLLVQVTCMLPREKIARKIEADSKYWRSKAELSKIISDVLQDAGTTYIDLVTARGAIAVTQEMNTNAERMRKRAEDLQKTDPSYKVLYESVRTEVVGRTQAQVKLKQQGDGAAAKLIYLLNLPCHTVLAPLDLVPVPVHLIDPTTPVCKLVEQALATGTGIQETRGLLASLQENHVKLACTLWLMTKSAKVQLAQARNREAQAELSIQDLSGKLTAGAQEGHEAIVLGLEQIQQGHEQVQHASETHRLAELRVKENAPGGSIPDVMQSVRALESARTGVLTAISNYNKAQVRLLLLLGPAPKPSPPPPEPMPPAPAPIPATP